MEKIREPEDAHEPSIGGALSSPATIIAYHGTDRTAFDRFDVSAAGPYNVGLHFGTRAGERLWFMPNPTIGV